MKFANHVLLAFFLFVFPVAALVNLDGLNNTVQHQCLANSPNAENSRLSVPVVDCHSTYREAMLESHPDKNKNTGDILNTYGYCYKIYNITSKDGYISTVYRITNIPRSARKGKKAKHKKKNQKKQVVYIMHGMTLASDCWFFQPGERNLVFKLANAGYEVWLGNARGTTYSLRHKTLSADNIEFWDFSWHEMAVYDFPAVVNKILKVSKTRKIFFIGHSMGSTLYFVSLSEIPSMNKKIKAAFLMTPQAYMGHTNHPNRLVVSSLDSYEKYKAANAATGGRVMSSEQLYKVLGVTQGDLCDVTAAQCGVCDNMFFALFGYDYQQMNHSVLPFAWSILPNSFPLKAMAHYSQLIMTCTFRQFDYGYSKNMEVYDQPTPPEYRLENIKTPTYFFHSEIDNFAQPDDVNITASKMRPEYLKGQYLIQHKLFNHADFAMAKDADKLVYNKILKIMRTYK